LESLFQTALDRFIPKDEGQRLQGRTFADFEQQANACGNEVLAAMLEERAKLDGQAEVDAAGRCPHCGSERTYLAAAAQEQEQELYAPSGGVSVRLQQARCRGCGRAFSPSAEGVGVACGGAVDAAGGAAGRAGSGGASV
jgi:predicted Zn-ribbon and HTH transcriptional regulator